MTSRTRSGKREDGSLLGADELLDPLARQGEHRLELGARVRRALGRGLELDQPCVFSHHAVEVGRGVKVLCVIQVEHRYAVDDAAADRRQRSEEHTSELQSPDHLVCRLLLEKKTSNYEEPLGNTAIRLTTVPP